LLIKDLQGLYNNELDKYEFSVNLSGYSLRLYEMRSQIDRAIAKHLGQFNNIEIYWLRSNHYLYDFQELTQMGNLDQVFKLNKPKLLRSYSTKEFPLPEITGRRVHIVAPAFDSEHKVIQFIEKVKTRLCSCNISISFHPTFGDKKLLDVYDSNQSDLSTLAAECEVFIGYDSNMLSIFSSLSKTCYVVFTESSDLKFLEENSDFDTFYYVE
jgi:hypothetical protein